MSIKELDVSGYRSIRRVHVAFQEVNVLTGPNGSGKSNLYKSLFLLAKTSSGGLARVIVDEGGMSSILWAGPRKARSSASARLEPV
jgi:predicted ATPase